MSWRTGSPPRASPRPQLEKRARSKTGKVLSEFRSCFNPGASTPSPPPPPPGQMFLDEMFLWGTKELVFPVFFEFCPLFTRSFSSVCARACVCACVFFFQFFYSFIRYKGRHRVPGLLFNLLRALTLSFVTFENLFSPYRFLFFFLSFLSFLRTEFLDSHLFVNTCYGRMRNFYVKLLQSVRDIVT